MVFFYPHRLLWLSKWTFFGVNETNNNSNNTIHYLLNTLHRFRQNRDFVCLHARLHAYCIEIIIIIRIFNFNYMFIIGIYRKFSIVFVSVFVSSPWKLVKMSTSKMDIEKMARCKIVWIRKCLITKIVRKKYSRIQKSLREISK